MAYSAEIDVKVRNLGSISQLEQKLSSISKSVNAINKKRLGGGASGGGGGGGSSRAANKENQQELAFLRVKNSALALTNRGLKVQNKLKDTSLDLTQKIADLEKIGDLKGAENLNNLKGVIEKRKSEIILAEKSLIEEKKKTAEVVKQVEIKKKLTSPTVVSDAALMGPHKATKGAGQVPMSIDTITKQSDKRLAVELKLRELEAQGVNTKKLRVKMGELVDAQNRKEFGTIKKINRELGRGISKEKGKLRVLKLQNQQRAKEDKEIRRTAPRQALNFDKRTGGLLKGPAGTSRNTLGNIGRRLAPKRGFDFGSALISGGFPLLFGQGPGIAAAGALGGGIGGMFGQMGGFAGGIAATAAVTSIQNVINGIGELGQAMNRLNPNISAMSKAMGIAGTVEEKRLQLIEQNQGKQAAFNAALQMMGDKIGADKAEELRKFGETFQKLGNDVTLFFTKVQAAVAKLLNQATEKVKETFIKPGEVRKFVRENPDNPAFSDVNQKITDIQNRKVRGAAANKQKTRDLNAAKAERREIAERLLLEEKSVEKKKTLNDLITDGLSGLKKENELNKAIIAGREKEFLIEQASKTLAEEMGQDFDKLEKAEQNRITNAVKNNMLLKEQAENAKAVVDAFESISQSIGNDIKEGIKGLIRGTSTLSDLLNNVADKFLDVALNQALFGDILGSSGTKKGGLLGFLGFADGGRPPVGRPSIVGEKGPELFVPRSSGNIIPNNKLGGGNTNNVVVNVDASGSDVQGDEAAAKEIGTLISVAVQGELLKQQRPGGLLSR